MNEQGQELTVKFTKKSFGKESEVTLQLLPNGTVDFLDADQKLIEGIPKAIFIPDPKTATKIDKMHFISYKIAIQDKIIEDANLALEDLEDESKSIVSGKPSARAKEKKKAKLLAQIAELEKED